MDAIARMLYLLMESELDAINEYSDIINTIDDEKIVSKLQEIKQDEQEHLSELSDLLGEIRYGRRVN